MRTVPVQSEVNFVRFLNSCQVWSVGIEPNGQTRLKLGRMWGLQDGLCPGDEAGLLRWAATPEPLVMCPPTGEPVAFTVEGELEGLGMVPRRVAGVLSPGVPGPVQGPPQQPVPRQWPAPHCTARERRWDLNRRLRCLSRREGFLEKVPLRVNGSRFCEAASWACRRGKRSPGVSGPGWSAVGLMPSSPGCSWLLSAAQPLPETKQE